MASVSRSCSTSPAQVFAVLSDGWSYSNWVVGTSHMRAVEDTWPAVGSKLHHAAGVWPFVARDESVVEQCYPERRLVLTARGRPFGEARVTVEIEADGPGSTVTLTEVPCAGPGKWLHNPATDALLARRNVEALSRLAAISNRTYANAASIEFDALVLVGDLPPAPDAMVSGDTKAGENGGTVATDPRVVKLVGEAWRHAKAIGVIGDSTVLDEIGASAEEPGVVLGAAKTVMPAMLELLAAHRAWERFATSADLA